MSPFQHALNDGSSVPSPRSGRGGGQVSTTGNCQKEKALACARKQIDSTVGDSGSDYMLDTFSLTSLHLGPLGRHRRGRAELLLLLAIICRDISRDKLHFAQGTFQATLPPRF